jgi:hypothetical protein
MHHPLSECNFPPFAFDFPNADAPKDAWALALWSWFLSTNFVAHAFRFRSERGLELLQREIGLSYVSRNAFEPDLNLSFAHAGRNEAVQYEKIATKTATTRIGPSRHVRSTRTFSPFFSSSSSLTSQTHSRDHTALSLNPGRFN